MEEPGAINRSLKSGLLVFALRLTSREIIVFLEGTKNSIITSISLDESSSIPLRKETLNQ